MNQVGGLQMISTEMQWQVSHWTKQFRQPCLFLEAQQWGHSSQRRIQVSIFGSKDESLDITEGL
jgi:hypothetical protein